MVPQIYGTAGEFAGDPCDDNDVWIRHVHREWLACIVVFRRGLDLPALNGVSALMLTALVDDDAVRGETPSHTTGVSCVCREIRRDGGRQVDGSVSVRSHRSTTHRDGRSRKNARESEELTCE